LAILLPWSWRSKCWHRSILGFDVSGVVEAVGAGVTLYRPGDEVFGMSRFPHPAGAYAHYVTAPPRHLARKPAGIDHVEAARNTVPTFRRPGLFPAAHLGIHRRKR
jgi:NADPH:quinone reductase-like Zn-dependent oxidoreductase